MKAVLKLLAVAAASLSLVSCGLPGALVRTAGSAVDSLGKVGNAAMSAAGY